MTPTKPPVTQPADCLVLAVDAEGPQDFNVLRVDSTDIVEATFSGYQKAKWNTPDGHRPSKDEFQNDTARLVRPLAMKLVGSQIKGSSDAANRAVQRGGTSGCDEVSYSNEPTLVEGQDYVFFLVPLTNSKQDKSEDYLVLSAFRVGADGLVDMPSDGQVSVPELTKAVENGLPSTPPPYPGEPSPSGPG